MNDLLAPRDTRFEDRAGAVLTATRGRSIERRVEDDQVSDWTIAIAPALEVVDDAFYSAGRNGEDRPAALRTVLTAASDVRRPVQHAGVGNE